MKRMSVLMFFLALLCFIWMPQQSFGQSTNDVDEAAQNAFNIINGGCSGCNVDAQSKQLLLQTAGSLKLESYELMSSQVVAGMIYNFNMEVMDSSGHSENMTVKFWSRPWLVQKSPSDAYKVLQVKAAGSI
uniref:Cystatin domain-containing protein n=1 Tax=Polytomella parva TaxID=51329 RepID=A0A7S0Y835_9CHLO|mmetsp:Transcript_12935/g.23000  ORF Transcript_12935/g.23000 Transcript_12935/m.23000 type:complete len:131 (+) Transcript_12935:197-589(+)|eukprot:CAMPEP_0175067072 /NCGR_PEP_ID=MMETSP0052_2-20121109/16880_1 /TAXON_ID=51329 ORGANISM="Polytomella parva, Strain SAG 63-3" /NCGR_SAMPLE_ID=MMETSP0052_2 /ASSEMBLY_ACC=CAM_ASM_000194 /LENGTH=130 /DNA_ID=CAMNT_0016333883 /DNA_START=183 /DNA_END=575 /DNA_ORIENTATION=-